MRRVVADLEANGFLDVATTVHCGVFKDIDTKEVFQFPPNRILEMLAWLDAEVGTCIIHNGIGYDWPLLEKLYGYTFKGEKIDTLVISRLQRPDRVRPAQMVGKGGPHSIAAWGWRLGRGKPDHEDWSTYSAEMLHRCTEDVEILHLTYNALMREAKDLGGNWVNAHKMSHALFEILQKQEEYGWLVDQEHLDKSLSMLQHWMDRISKVLAPRLPQTYDILEQKKVGEYGWVKKPFLKNGSPSESTVKHFETDWSLVKGPFSRIEWRPLSLDKDAEVKQYLLDCGWEPMEWNKNDAGEVTSPKMSKDDPFEGVQGSMGRLIAKRVQCKSRKSILEGWKERLRSDGRLSSIITGLAVTGRAKHSNIVNVPNASAFFGKWMRKCFSCRPDMVLVSCDSKGCQDRMLAQRAKNDEFTKMLLEGDKDKGTDSHSIARDGVNVVLKANDIPVINRSKAKNFNYGWKFGASDNKLGKMVSSNGDIGLQIRKALEGIFPAQAAVVDRLREEWMRNAKKELKWGKIRYRDGWFAGLDGRPIYVDSEHALLVYCLQSDEALVMSAAYVFLYKKLLSLGYEWGKDWAYVCWMHDEYTIECKPELAEEIKGHAEWAIGYAGKYFKLNYCPQQGDGSIGRNWYEVH